MKLKSKLLAALTPVIALSAATPVLVACSKEKSYKITFGDSVNCLDKKAKGYHSIKAIGKAVKRNINVEPTTSSMTIDQINKTLTTDAGFQNTYFELLSFHTLGSSKAGFILSNWSVNESKQISFTWQTQDVDQTTYENLDPQYSIGHSDDGAFVCLEFCRNGDPVIAGESYTFKDINIIE